jgi:hypothetical protein
MLVNFMAIGIFYRHFVYFLAIWQILWQFDKFYGHLANCMVVLVYFSSFGMLYQKNLATLAGPVLGSPIV